MHSFAYDALGRLTHATDPDTEIANASYDDRDFLVQHPNGEGETIDFDYDEVGRLTRRGETSRQPPTTFTPMTTTTPTRPRDLCHVAARLAAVTEPGGEVHFCYDPPVARSESRGRSCCRRARRDGQSPTATQRIRSRRREDVRRRLRDDVPVRRRRPDVGVIGRHRLDGTDDRRRRARAGEPYGNDATQSYAYDSLGLASDLTVGGVASDPLRHPRSAHDYGAPTIVTDQDHQGLDQAATYGYDVAARLTEPTLGAPDPEQFAFTFEYDGLQNMTERRVTQGSASAKDIGVLTGIYKYKERGYGPRQLTSVIP